MSEFTDEIKKIKVTFTDGTSEDFESFKELEEYLKDDDEEADSKEENITDNEEPMSEDDFKSYKARRLAEKKAKKNTVEALIGA